MHASSSPWATPPARMAACTPSLREALNESISSGKFVDTKIVLFSQKDSSGTICKPKALYANSRVLRTVPYFNDLLFGQFGEAEAKDFSEPLDDCESTEDYGYYSDSDLEDDGSVSDLKGELRPKTAPGSHPPDLLHSVPIENEPTLSYGDSAERVKKGKVIRIRDVAFITFQAFLFYLYTNSIDFAPHGSEHSRKSKSAKIASISEYSVPRPSPKSIYRLADKYDVPALKQLALDNIKDGLGRCDIIDEIFSEFSSKYDEIRIMQVEHLASSRFGMNEETTKSLCDEIDEKVDAYAAGDLKHAAGVMILLWEASKKRKRLAAPASARAPTPQVMDNPVPATPSPENWGCVKRALIRSIRDGVFADRRLLVRHSGVGKILRPVYFSSIVVSERLPHINRPVKKYSGVDEYFRGDDAFEDSDCEDGLGRTSDAGIPGTVAWGDEERDKAALHALSIGSFTSWKALFFYLLTGSIKFAPLRSQGWDTRASHIREAVELDPHTPPPCSPKAIHSLAVALGVKCLQDLAFKDVQSKMTSVNVVEELFSSLTSRRIEMAKMQYDLLSDKFADEAGAIASAADLIKSMADGTRAHQAEALKFGLREGFSRTKSTHCGKCKRKGNKGTAGC